MKFYKNNKNKIDTSIKSKMLAVSIFIVLSSTISIVAISSYLNYSGIISTLEKTLIETAKTTAERINNRLWAYRTLAEEISSKIIFNSPLVSEKEKNDGDIEEGVTEKEIIEELKLIEKRHDLTIADVVDKDGFALRGNVDISDRDYFKVVKETNEPYVSDLIHRKDTGEVTLVISAPIMKNNEFNGIIMLGLDGLFLSELVSSIHVGDSGTSEIMDKEGTTIAYIDTSFVLNQWNTFEKVEDDKSLEKLAEITSERIKGVAGFGKYKYDGENRLAAYAPIPNTNGWTIDVSVDQDEFIKYTASAILTSCVLGIIFTIISILVFIKLASSIAKPIKELSLVAESIADGNYDVDISINSKDECGVLARNMGKMIEETKEIITDTSRGLKELSEGNFNIQPNAKYSGVFKEIESSMHVIIDRLSSTMKDINTSAEQVSIGSSQVAAGANDIANGATEQASIIEEFIASLEEFSYSIDENVEQVTKTAQSSIEANNKAKDGVYKMKELLSAMEAINNSGTKVTDIIKVIDNIASQTNLLALNAAIESARAGEVGKGFAVVANEIRDLANRSSETVKEIERVIKESSEKIILGKSLADTASISLNEIVQVVDETAIIAEKLLDSSEEQKATIQELLQGTNQISEVVESNSANSEESAAISEELMAQAENLSALIGQFELKDA